tara:strand:+ start:3556 stop:4863 length:1308 start_codon:yes stop_codon:yes gene_type:complete
MLLALLPFLVIRFLARKKTKSFNEDFMVRFFGYSKALQKENKKLKKNIIWIHAVSLGEVQGALPLIEQLYKKDRLCNVVLTVTTKSAWKFMQNYLESEMFADLENFTVEILPLDFPWATERFCKCFNPTVLALVETEIWPNLIYSCKKNQIKVMLINGRLSSRSFHLYKNLRRFFMPVINEIDMVIAQSRNDSVRFIELGYNKKVSVLNNLKFDVSLKKNHVVNGLWFRAQCKKKIVWLALSTRDGEEKEIIDCWRNRFSPEMDEILILVPRHPERFKKALKEAQLAGFSVDTRTKFLRTEGVSSNPCPSILIGDSIGEVQMYLAASDIVLIGGSIKPFGGQNPLEACLQKKVIFFGDYMFNFQEISNGLINESAAIRINRYRDWFAEGSEILKDKNKSKCFGDNAYNFIRKRSGSSTKYADLLLVDQRDINSNF